MPPSMDRGIRPSGCIMRKEAWKSKPGVSIKRCSTVCEVADKRDE